MKLNTVKFKDMYIFATMIKYTWLMLTKGGFYSEGTDMFAKSPNR